jgi:hypothetical protein
MAEEIGVAFVRLVPSMRGFGPAAADAMNQAVRGPAQTAGRQAGSRFGDAFKTVLLGAGVAAGAALVLGVGQALDQSKITGRLGAQLGATPAEAEKFGKVAGQLFAKGITTDFQGAADAISVTMRSGLLPPGATNAQIESISTKVSDLAGTFELDLGQSANAVGQIMKTGLAPNAQTALDVITKGLQTMGPRADDIADTFNEYSVIFQRLGFDATTATGLMSQGLKAGARDTDVVADALKEFTIEGVAGSQKMVDGFKAIGLNSKDMISLISQGGPQATQALQMTLDRLRSMEDPIKRDAAAAELFGTKSEDMQKALLALDPSKATQALGVTAGAADGLGDSLRDNAGARLTAFQNTLSQAFVEFLGGQVIPVVEDFIGWMKKNEDTVKIVGAAITGLLIPALVLMAVNATVSAATTVAAWVSSGASALASAGTQIGAAASTVGAWIAMAAGAVANAATVAAAWLGAALRSMVTFALQVVRTALMTVAQFVLMAARAVVWAAVMAAQWLIAMGPIGLVIALVAGLVALIIIYWDDIVKFTKAAWDWVWEKLKAIGKAIVDFFLNWTLPGLIIKHWSTIRTKTMEIWNAVVNWVKGIPGKIIALFLNWTLPGLIIKHWQAIKDGTVRKALEMVAWVKGLPGRIASAIGNLGNLLFSKGQDVVRGLLNGIKSMGSWLKSQLISFARTMIPGPIAKALGIGSPSKLMAKAVGRWVPAGIAVGWEDNLGVLTAMGERTAASMPAPASMLPGVSAGARAPAPAGTTVVIDGSNMPSALWEWLKNNVRTEGGGIVQTALGYNPR